MTTGKDINVPTTIEKQCPACLRYIPDDRVYCIQCETKIVKKREGDNGQIKAND